jgi:hypothetical protein
VSDDPPAHEIDEYVEKYAGPIEGTAGRRNVRRRLPVSLRIAITASAAIEQRRRARTSRPFGS